VIKYCDLVDFCVQVMMLTVCTQVVYTFTIVINIFNTLLGLMKVRFEKEKLQCLGACL
jgi:hypothetical protein